MPGIGAAEIAADELQRELLKHFVGRVFVAERGERVAAHRPAVAVEHLLLGRLHGRVVAVGQLDDRPQGLNLAEMGIVVHGGLPWEGELLPSQSSRCRFGNSSQLADVVHPLDDAIGPAVDGLRAGPDAEAVAAAAVDVELDRHAGLLQCQV